MQGLHLGEPRCRHIISLRLLQQPGFPKPPRCLPTSRRPLPRSCGLGKESQAPGTASSLILGGFYTASQRPGPQALLPWADTLILTPSLISLDRPGKQVSIYQLGLRQRCPCTAGLCGGASDELIPQKTGRQEEEPPHQQRSAPGGSQGTREGYAGKTAELAWTQGRSCLTPPLPLQPNFKTTHNDLRCFCLKTESVLPAETVTPTTQRESLLLSDILVYSLFSVSCA